MKNKKDIFTKGLPPYNLPSYSMAQRKQTFKTKLSLCNIVIRIFLMRNNYSNWHFCYPHPIYPTPPLGQDMTQGQFFKRSLTGLNSEFSFS